MASSRARRLTVAGIVLLTLELVVFAGGCADRLLLFPTREPIAARDAQGRRELATPEGTLEIWTERSRPREDAATYVLAFDGNGSRAEYAAPRVARLFADRPAEVWAVNYPGYGGSSGDAELARLAPAGLAAYDEVARAAPGRPIAVYGNSIGATVALHVAANRLVAYAVLQNPPPLRRLILQRNGWWNAWLLALPVALCVPGDLDAIATAGRVHAPAVFVTAQDDTLVPPPYQDRVFEAYAGAKRRVFTSGGHNGGLDEETADQVREALSELTR